MRIWGKQSRVKMVVPVISAEKQLEIFAVDLETPLLVGVLALLAGMEEQGKEQVMICELKDSDRAFYAGGISKIADAQEQIISLVLKGNEAKRGGRQTTDARRRT